MNASFSRSRFGVISRISKRAVRGVDGRVERQQLIAERQLVAVLFDERADVVAREGHGKPGERPGGGVARRERVGVVVHRDRFVVPGHHHHAVVPLALHRALRAQPFEVRVRVGDALVAAEEVDRVVVGHGNRTSSGCTGRSNRIGAWISRSPSRNAIWPT